MPGVGTAIQASSFTETVKLETVKAAYSVLKNVMANLLVTEESHRIVH